MDKKISSLIIWNTAHKAHTAHKAKNPDHSVNN